VHVLVTGGTGFIGNHVVRLCLAQGDRVRVMVLPGEDLAPLAGLDVELVEGDLARPETLAAAVDGVEGLYHLAAIYAIWLPDPSLIYRVNVEGTRALMQAAMAAGVGRIVYTSSVAALGLRPDGRPGDETVGFNCWATANDYVLSKYMAEQEVRALIARGLPAVIVNPAFPIGPGDRGPTPTGDILLSVLRGRVQGWVDGIMSVVDVRDVARGHVLAMAHGRIGEGYILANAEGNIDIRGFAKAVQRIAGVRKVPDRRIPRPVALAIGRMHEAAADLTGRRPLATYRAILHLMNKLHYDPTKAVRELGLPQTPFEVTLEEAIAWFRQNGYA
jgi:dihydroflavonol-4-reductase